MLLYLSDSGTESGDRNSCKGEMLLFLITLATHPPMTRKASVQKVKTGQEQARSACMSLLFGHCNPNCGLTFKKTLCLAYIKK